MRGRNRVRETEWEEENETNRMRRRVRETEWEEESEIERVWERECRSDKEGKERERERYQCSNIRR